MYVQQRWHEIKIKQCAAGIRVRLRSQYKYTLRSVDDTGRSKTEGICVSWRDECLAVDIGWNNNGEIFYLGV